MKKASMLVAVLVVLGAGSARATMTYLRINGVDSNFAMVQGDTFTWQADCDSGADVWCEIWYDLNDNAQIDEGVDKAWQAGFTQTDGDTNGDGGPSDMDGTVNGEVMLSLPLGLAPGIWMLRFTDMTDTSAVAHAGTVYAIPAPFRVITGSVSGPAGFDSSDVFVQIDDNGRMWSALTDADGVYYLNTDSSFAQGETVLVQAEDVTGAVAPAEQQVVLAAADTVYGIDFAYLPPAAYVYGWVKDEYDSIVSPEQIYLISSEDQGGGGGGDNYKMVRPDSTGFFLISYGLDDTGKTWRLGMHVEGSLSGHMEAPDTSVWIGDGDSTRRDMICLVTDTVITGTVTEDSSSPSKAYRMEFESNEGSASALSDAGSGAYSIPVSSGCSKGQVRINTSPDDDNGTPLPAGYAIEDGNYKSAYPGDVIDFNLIQGGEISGTVMSETDSVGLGNMELSLRTDKDQWVDNTQTDSTGNYSFTGIAPGNYRVMVYSGSGYIGEYYDDTPDQDSAQIFNVTGGSSHPGTDFYLAQGSYITGYVKATADSSPVNDCWVDANPAGGGSNYGDNSDASGYYEIIVEPGSYFVKVNNPPDPYAGEEYDNQPHGAGIDTVVVGVGDTASGVDFYLAEGGVISGMVRLAADSSAFKSGYLELRDDEYNHIQNIYQDGSGFFEITGVAPGRYFLWASGGGSGSYLDEYWDNAHDPADADTIVITGGDTAAADFYMDAYPVLFGYVTSDSSGNTEALTNVEVFLWSVDNDTNPVNQTWADSTGRYEFKVDPGQYKVQIDDRSGYYTDEFYHDADDFSGADTITLTAGDSVQADEGLDIARGRVTGNVARSADSSGISGITVYAYYHDGDAPVDSVLTDGSGDYVFTGLPAPHDYHMLAYGIDQDYVLAWYNGSNLRDYANSFMLNDGDTATAVDFFLDTGAVVRGSVFAAIDTSAIAGAEVGLFFDGGSHEEYMVVTTDAGGAFEFRGVPTENCRLVAYAGDQGYGTEWWDSQPHYYNGDQIYITAPLDTGSFDFYLDASGSISGTLYSDAPGSAAVAGISVTVYNSTKNEIYTVAADSTGQYTLDGLVPGTYYLRAADEQGHFGEWYQDVDGDSSHLADSVVLLNPADTAGFDFYLTPEAMVNVQTYKACNSGNLWIDREVLLISAATGDTQSYNGHGDQCSWGMLDAGTYIVQLSAPAYVDPAPETTSLAAGETWQLDLYLEPAMVINEVMYKGGDPQNDSTANPEFVELYVVEETPLDNWQVTNRDGSSWGFSPGDTAGPGDYVVVRFRTGADTVIGNVHYVYRPGMDVLRDEGGYAGLNDPQNNGADLVAYEGGLDWNALNDDEFCGWPGKDGMATDPGAAALDTVWSVSMIPDGNDVNNGSNWYNSIVTPGAANERGIYYVHNISGTGTYTFANLGLELEVLSVTGSDTVSVTVYADSFPSSLPSGNNPVKRFFNINKGPSITDITAVLTFHYDQTEYDASDITDEATLYAARYTGSGWEQHASTVDTKNDMVSCTTTVFSIWALGGDGGPVPVELSSFTAAQAGAGVLLAWSTASEQDNLGWNVFRQLDDGDGYVKISPALVPGSGTTAGTRTYSFGDDGLPAGYAGTVSYYLQQVDVNGNSALSPVVTLDVFPTAVMTPGADLPVYGLSAGPNPFTDGSVVSFTLDRAAPVRLAVFRTDGSLAATLQDGLLPAGTYRRFWNGADDAGRVQKDGLYLYRLSVEGRMLTGYLLKTR